MPTTLALALALVATSVLTVFAALLLAGAFVRSRGAGAPSLDGGGDAAFLFARDASLVDVNDAGMALLDSLRRTDGEFVDEWNRLADFLTGNFAEFSQTIAALPTSRRDHLTSEDHALELTLEWVDGAIRLIVSDTAAEGGTLRIDRLSYRAMQDELALMRRMTESAPLMMWRENAEGEVTWANGAYLNIAAKKSGSDGVTWPLPQLFAASTDDDGSSRRVSLDNPIRLDNGKPSQNWFDLRRIRVSGEVLGYAIPADLAQKAEKTRRDFIQTLTKTFATLPIGLAVFDRARRLQVFNPVLTDLTGLEPEFLASAPGIEGFLNRMRDKHILPEPRDYRTWRKRLLEIESTGQSGDFEETWTLPSGQCFRVSANPYPDGALAFLIEDITSETHLNRNVRAEAETSQSVLNQLDEAIAVFAANGQLVLTNDAFSRLWTLEGEDSLAAITLPEALENWREAGDNSDLWAQIAALSRPGESPATPVTGIMRLSDGECLTVEGRRTSTGALMITFAQTNNEAARLPSGPRTARRAQILRASA